MICLKILSISIKKIISNPFPGGPVELMPVASRVRDVGLTLGWETKILHAGQCPKKGKNKISNNHSM